MKLFLLTFLFFLSTNLLAQDSTFVLSAKMFGKDGILSLPDLKEWRFKEGHDTAWSKPAVNDALWQKLDSLQIGNSKVNDKGIFEGWFRIRIKLDSSFRGLPVYLSKNIDAAADVYINGKYFHSFGTLSRDRSKYHSNTNGELPPVVLANTDTELLIAVHLMQWQNFLYTLTGNTVLNQESFLSLANQDQYNTIRNQIISRRTFFITVISILGALTLLFWLLTFLNRSQKHLMLIAISVTCIGGVPALNFFRLWIIASRTSNISFILDILTSISLVGVLVSLPLLISQIFTNRIHRFLKLFVVIFVLVSVALPFLHFDLLNYLEASFSVISFVICAYYLIAERKKLKGSKWAIVIGLILTILVLALLVLLVVFRVIGGSDWVGLALLFAIELIFPLSLLIYVAFWLKEMIYDVQEKANKIIQVTEEKKQLLESQNVILETQVNQRTLELSQSLESLKATQSQLIQSEKMASLGELTAGIAHEIQNPLNFVNNFSEVNKELLAEMKDEMDKGNIADAKEIANDVIANEEKINHHGKRADAIVKGMLQHSSSGSGKKEPTDINALADEYLRLAYHGLRAKDKTFNATMKTDFDETIGNINIIPQDIGRVILNLITNAFYVVNEKSKQNIHGYEPTVSVSTKKDGNKVLVSVKDNGNGIPKKILDKIFQPFFTTKPTGQGTGLGLSLSYDIMKAHGGELKVETKEARPDDPVGRGEGSQFIIYLPIS